MWVLEILGGEASLEERLTGRKQVPGTFFLPFLCVFGFVVLLELHGIAISWAWSLDGHLLRLLWALSRHLA